MKRRNYAQFRRNAAYVDFSSPFEKGRQSGLMRTAGSNGIGASVRDVKESVGSIRENRVIRVAGDWQAIRSQ